MKMVSHIDQSALDALAGGWHSDPFSLLGIHREGGVRIVRTLQPQATAVALVSVSGEELSPMQKVHPGGLFEAQMPPRVRRYRLRITSAEGSSYVIEDPYRFPTTMGDLDLYLMGQGSHRDIFRKLGAHQVKMQGIFGTVFAVWAPNASRVSVIGSFNDWDGRRHIMRVHPGNGIWEIFIPGVCQRDKYKIEMLDQS